MYTIFSLHFYYNIWFHGDVAITLIVLRFEKIEQDYIKY